MGLLDDAEIFAAVVMHGGFSHAARYLGLSNGLVSRRIAVLERTLGVTLLKRSTRQIHLTAEGEVFWRHAQRMQEEMQAALCQIQNATVVPQGFIRVSAPHYFGRHYLMPLILEFLQQFPEITIDLVLTNQQIDALQQQVDLIFRGAGFLSETKLPDSSLQMKKIFHEKIKLYASHGYLDLQGAPKTPQELTQHTLISYTSPKLACSSETWTYQQSEQITVHPRLACNDIQSALFACCNGFGIARFTDLNAESAVHEKKIFPVLTEYDWGDYFIFAIYAQQRSLPARTRVLLDFLVDKLPLSTQREVCA